MGFVEKAEYYITRVLRGKTEAMFSVMKKISLSKTNRKFKGIKIKPFKSDDFFRAGIET